MPTIGGVVGNAYIIQSSTNLADTNARVKRTNLNLTQPVEFWGIQTWTRPLLSIRKRPTRFCRGSSEKPRAGGEGRARIERHPLGHDLTRR